MTVRSNIAAISLLFGLSACMTGPIPLSPQVKSETPTSPSVYTPTPTGVGPISLRCVPRPSGLGSECRPL